MRLSSIFLIIMVTFIISLLGCENTDKEGHTLLIAYDDKEQFKLIVTVHHEENEITFEAFVENMSDNKVKIIHSSPLTISSLAPLRRDIYNEYTLEPNEKYNPDGVRHLEVNEDITKINFTAEFWDEEGQMYQISTSYKLSS